MKQKFITIFIEISKLYFVFFLCTLVCRQVFDHFDSDKNGRISVSELDIIFKLAKLNVTTERLQKFMLDLDKDGKDLFIKLY